MAIPTSEQQGNTFITETLRAFAFVQTECEYSDPVVSASHEGMSSDFTAIRYQSADMFLVIFYAHMESELSLKFGLLQKKHDYDEFRLGFDLDEALSFSGNADVQIQLPHPRSLSALQQTVNALASIVNSHLRDVLCSPQTIAKWVESRKTLADETRAKNTRKGICSAAEDAWEQQDYRTVVSLYEGVVDSLGALELKRLGYAKKHR